MFRLALALLLFEPSGVAAAPSADTPLEGSLPRQAGTAPGEAKSEQGVDQDEVSLIQLGLAQARREQSKPQAKAAAAASQADELAAAAKREGPRGAAAAGTAQTASFVSADGLLCFEGAPRDAEGDLAVKKASPVGRLYDDVYAASGTTCAERGYSMAGGADHCYPGVTYHMRAPDDDNAFAAAEMAEMASYGQRFGHSVDTVHLMFDCTCHVSSALVARRGSQCRALDGQPGAWVHHDPSDEQELTCNEGPFVLATLALAVLKSSLQLPMHVHDTVAAAGCASLGFPMRDRVVDHCFPPMRIWTRTDMEIDADMNHAQEVEVSLFDGDGFQAYFSSRGLSVNGDVLRSVPGCHCMSGTSALSQTFVERGKDCSEPKNHPPVRDWWTSAWTSPWPPLP